MTQRFTGWHMLTIILGFFGLVIAVNFAMARLAFATFGGEVVENSYVASQRYDGWLKAAAEQRALGWHAVPRVDAGGVLHITMTDASGRPLVGGLVVTARHPLGRMPDRRMPMRGAGGDYVAPRALPPGRWLLHIELRANGHDARFEDEVRA